MLTIFISFGPVFMGYLMLVFIFQFKVFHFSAFFLSWSETFRKKKTIAFNEILHHFRRLHPPFQTSTYLTGTGCGNKSSLAAGLPYLDI